MEYEGRSTLYFDFPKWTLRSSLVVSLVGTPPLGKQTTRLLMKIHFTPVSSLLQGSLDHFIYFTFRYR